MPASPDTTMLEAADTRPRPVDYDALRPLSSTVELLDIVTIAFSAHAAVPLRGLAAAAMEQTIRHRATRQGDDSDLLLSLVEFEYAVSLDQQQVAGVAGSFMAMYALPGGDEAGAPDLLDVLAEVNGTLNTWPYVRELITTCLAKLGLTGVMLPVYRPPAHLPPKGEFNELSTVAPPEPTSAP